MTSEWDGTAWAGVPAKAVIGPYASRVEYGTPLSGLNRSPQKRMREAQALYHTNPWIRTAEAAVTRKVVGLPWHLETSDDEDIPDNATGLAGEVVKLLERPQANLSAGRKMTRRELWAITSRHMGLCGMAYWYLDQLHATARTPLGIIYVNPARVWCAADEVGNLTGWVLDARDDTGRGGTPLELDELLPFYLDSPDSGHYGSGLVEAAFLKAQITTLADRHAAYILGTGGRLPGIVSPKEGTIPEEKYKQLVAEFRNVNEAPDAAKRTTVVAGPIDFIATSSSPTDLMLGTLSTMNRDDILAVWGVPPSQAAIPSAAGLNSGESRKYDEATLMQGAVHDRIVSIRETIQYGLLDRYQKLGLTLDLEIEEPEFDDATPAYENAARAVNIPLTNDERRAIIGLGPLDDAMAGAVVLLPLTLTPFSGQPDVMPTVGPPGKAGFRGLRSKMEARFVPSLRKTLAGVLAAQRATVAAKVREHGPKIARKPSDTTVWWNAAAEDERLGKILRAGSAGIAQTVARQIGALLEVPAKAPPVAFEDRVVAYVAKRTGERVTLINETTRDAIRAAITEGFDGGLSPAQVGELIENLPAFDEARAELVARTETMFAYNDAALTSYGEFGVTEVLAYDGDGDPECAARDGQTFSIEEAAGIEDHPNGTLDWAPVVSGRALLEAKRTVGDDVDATTVRQIVAEMMKAGMSSSVIPQITISPQINVPEGIVTVNVPAEAPIVTVTTPAPIVNVTTPEVHVSVPTQPAPTINVVAPETKAALPQEIRIVSMPDRVSRKSVARSAAGQIIDVIEETVDG